MFGLTGLAYAMGTPLGGGAAGGGAQSALMNLVPLVFMFAIFYFLLIRPQQKKAKDHRALLDSIKKGDQVITAGGMHGKVTALDETVVTLEISNGVNVKINKGHIASVVKKD
jgi:preprotein translocase subunit YajC